MIIMTTLILPFRERIKIILGLALPIIGGMLSQNILNLVDTAMIGVLGTPSLAAVGAGGLLTFFGISGFIGLGEGVQALTSRRLGEKRLSQLGIPLNAGLVLVLCVAIPLTALLYQLAPFFYQAISKDPQVQAIGVSYYRILVLGLTVNAMNFSFRGFWNGVGAPKSYMIILIVTHLCNIFLNWVLIFGNFGMPAMGEAGAAIATVSSLHLGFIMLVIYGSVKRAWQGYCCRWPDNAVFRSLIKVSVPAAVRQFFFGLGVVASVWIIGHLGTESLAIHNVLINLILVAILPGIGFGLAALTLVGKSLGEKDPESARAWGEDVMRIGTMALLILGVICFFLPNQILGVFIHDPVTLNKGIAPFRLDCLTIWIEVLGLIVAQALTGAGSTAVVMRISLGTQWLLFMPIVYVICPVLGYGLFTFYVCWAAYQACATVLLWRVWKAGKWVPKRF